LEGGYCVNDEITKHLEMIQAVISRHAWSSFAYKGWFVVVIAALGALAASEATPRYLIVALVATLTFWGLDAFYLRQERLFRELYDAVRRNAPNHLEDGPFTMNTRPYVDQVDSWWRTCWSRSVA
jgi:hypothetical protein